VIDPWSHNYTSYIVIERNIVNNTMDNVPYPYDLQLVCFHLLIYLLWKDHEEKHHNNNNNNNKNNTMTLKYDFRARSIYRFFLIFSRSNLVIIFLQVDRVGEKVVVVVVVVVAVVHYHSHLSRSRRCSSSPS